MPVIEKSIAWQFTCNFHFLLGENRHGGENTLFIVDAVNWKANAAKLPSAGLHLNAPKLESVLVKQRFTHCLVATRDVLSSLQFFLARTKESNTCARFCANAWICARPYKIHHDLVSVVQDEKRESNRRQTSKFYADIMFLELIIAVTCFFFFFHAKRF